MTTSQIFLYKSTLLPLSDQHWFFKTMLNMSNNTSLRPLILVKSPQQKAQLLKLWYKQSTTTCLLPDIFTLDEWLLNMVPFEINTTQSVQRLCLYKALKSHPFKTKWYSEIANTRGFYHHFFECYSLTKENLTSQILPAFFKSKKKTDAVHQLLSAFDSVKKKLNLFSMYDVYDYLSKRPHILTANCEQYDQLFIYGIDELKPYQKSTIYTVLTTAKSSSYLIHYDAENPLYESNGPTFNWLLNAFTPSPLVMTAPQNKTAKRAVTLGIFETIEEEALNITEHIADSMVTHKGDVSFIVPNFAEYGPYIQKAFRLYGFSSCIDGQIWAGMTGSGPHALIQFMSAFLNLCAHLNWNHLRTFLDGPFITRSIINNDTLILDKKLLMTLLQEAPLDQSFAEIIRHVTHKKNALLTNINAPAHASLQFENPKQVTHSLDNHVAFIAKLLDHIDRIKTARNIETLLNETHQLLQSFCILNKNNEFPTDFSQQIESPVYNLMEDSLNKIYEFYTIYFKCFAAEESSLFIDFTELATTFKLFITPPTSEKKHGKISILSPEDGMHAASEVVYVCGLTESNWPKLNPHNIFYTPTFNAEHQWNTRTQRIAKSHQQLAYYVLAGKKVVLTSVTPETNPITHALTHVLSHLDITPGPFPVIAPKLLSLEDAVLAKNIALDHSIPQQTNRSHTPNLPNDELKQFFSRHVYTVTQLEAYQKCPYYFFNRYVLKIDPQEEIELDITNLEWGRFFHEILQHYFIQLHKSHMIPSQHSEQACSAIIHDIAHNLFKKRNLKNLFWKIKYNLLMGPNKNGLLQEFVQHDCESNWHLHPVEMEFKFKLSEQLNEIQLSLKGVVDLIQFDHSHSQFVICDFKTGKTLPTAISIKEYQSLQLPVYLMAIQAHWPEKKGIGAYIFQAHSKGLVKKKVLLAEKEAIKNTFNIKRERPVVLNEAYMSHLQIHLEQLIQKIEAGAFSHKTEDSHTKQKRERTQHCRLCPYTFACSYKDRFEHE